jgi:hypothetical protein
LTSPIEVEGSYPLPEGQLDRFMFNVRVKYSNHLFCSSSRVRHWNHTQKGQGMKAISASVVVLAGMILLLGGAFVAHSDSRLFVQSVGCLVGIIGLAGWFSSIRKPDDK